MVEQPKDYEISDYPDEKFDSTAFRIALLINFGLWVAIIYGISELI